MRLEIQIPSDFSFVETLNAHGWRRLAPFECDDAVTTLVRPELMPDGSVALLSISNEDSKIYVDIEGCTCAAEVIRRVRLMLQLDVPVARFHKYCASNFALNHIPAKKQGRMLCSPTVWEDCCKVILTTNTTWSQTVSMTRRLVDLYGTASNLDPNRRTFPSPQQVASVPYHEFEVTARFGYRNLSIHRLATSIASGEIDLESFRSGDLAGPDLWKRLISLRGVGPYAASCLMIYLGRYDRVNVDSWARMMVGKELNRPVSDREVHEFFAPHGEWSGLVYHFYPWREEEPAY